MKFTRKASRLAPTRWTILALLLLVLILVATFETQAHAKFNEVSKELDRIAHADTLSKEMEDKSSPVANTKVGGLEDILKCLDNRCPGITKTWTLTLEQSKTHQFLDQALTKAGYTKAQQSGAGCDFSLASDCWVAGVRDGHYAGISLRPRTNSGNSQSYSLDIGVTLK